jgi:hypothetical protein
MLITGSAFAQKEAYNWTFGNNAGLSWNTTQNFTGIAAFGTLGGDVNLTDIPTNWRTAIVTNEGCFTVSDPAGNLMFYSDGITIWNKNNVAMLNGTGLTGHASSVQSGIVIPYPGQSGKYIVFSVNANKSGDLAYSLVDMSLDGGLGGVVTGQKNIPLTGTGGSFGESLTAVMHSNKRDLWVVATARNASNVGTINVWKIDLAGVHNTAPHSSINTGMVFGDTWLGYMRFSKDGTKFWQCGGSNAHRYFLATFDPSTGIFLQGKIKTTGLTTSLAGAYGTEFSPNGQYLYATDIYGTSSGSTSTYLYVWDFDALMNAADITTVTPLIIKSYTGALNTGTPTRANVDNIAQNHFGAILMGPDGRMYIANAFTNSMFIIPNPDNDPTNLKIYKLEHLVDVNNGALIETNSWGLPVYATFNFNLQLTSTPPLCKEKQADFQLSVTDGIGADNFAYYTIDWGDGSPPVTNSSPQLDTTYNYTHTYAEQGDYTITFNAYDVNNNVILPNTKVIHVGGCWLPVNPHLRGRMQ